MSLTALLVIIGLISATNHSTQWRFRGGQLSVDIFLDPELLDGRAWILRGRLKIHHKKHHFIVDFIVSDIVGLIFPPVHLHFASLRSHHLQINK